MSSCGLSTQYSPDTYYRPAVLYNSGRSLVLRTLCTIVHITDWSLLESRGLYKDRVRDTLGVWCGRRLRRPALLLCGDPTSSAGSSLVDYIYLRLLFTSVCRVHLAAPVAGSRAAQGAFS